MGNLTEKQTQRAFGRKIQKNTKQAGWLNTKTGRQIWNNKPKMSKFTQKPAQISFCSKLKEQNGHEIWQKSNLQYRNLQKTSPKNKQILINTSPKTSNPQIFKKKPQIHKKQARIRGKTAMLATLPSSSFRHSLFESVFLFTIECSSPIEPFGFNALSFCESILFVHLTALRGGERRVVRTVGMVGLELNTWRGPPWNFEQKTALTLRPPPSFYCCPPSTPVVPKLFEIAYHLMFF